MGGGGGGEERDGGGNDVNLVGCNTILMEHCRFVMILRNYERQRFG